MASSAAAWLGGIVAWGVSRQLRKVDFGNFKRGVPAWISCGLALLSAFTLSGCFLEYDCVVATSCGGPQRLVPVDSDLTPIIAYTDYAAVMSRYSAASTLEAKKAVRNEFIFERIYAMDVRYTAYEEKLTREAQDEGFFAAVTNAALTGTAALIPVAQTTRLLSGIAAGLTTADQAYDKQYLYNRAVQVLQSQMRAKRADVASHIVVRADYPVTKYPLGMALSDLEKYYRAGTLPSAFIDLSERVGTEANVNKKAKDVLKGGGNEVTTVQHAVSGGNEKVTPRPPNTPVIRTPPTEFGRDANSAILETWLGPIGTPNRRDRLNTINDFISRIPTTAAEAAPTITQFFNSGKYSAARRQFAIEQKLINQ
jgi:hypothetical protein